VVEKGKAWIDLYNASETYAQMGVNFQTRFIGAPEIEISLQGFRQALGGPGQAAAFLTVLDSSGGGFNFRCDTGTHLQSETRMHEVCISWVATGKAEFDPMPH